MSHSRMERVNELLKEEIGRILDQDLSNPELPDFITVHTVEASKDLRSAQVWVTFLGVDDPKEVAAAVRRLNSAAGFIQGELGRRVVLRYTPRLHFHYTGSTNYAAKMEEVFHKIEPFEPKPEDDEPKSDL